MGITAEFTGLGCKRMYSAFSWNGSQNKMLYFTSTWNKEKCKPVSWQSDYSAFERDGYKKCVCTDKIGVESPNCQQSSDNPDPNPTPEPEPEPNPNPDPEPNPNPEPVPNPLDEIRAMLEAIRENPHYDPQNPSKTTWQIDETLDYVEEKLYNVEVAFRNAGYM